MFHHRFFGVKMDFAKSKDDLKQDTEKYLRGLLEAGTIDYELYSYICDEFDSCINMAFELGKQEGIKKNGRSQKINWKNEML